MSRGWGWRGGQTETHKPSEDYQLVWLTAFSAAAVGWLIYVCLYLLILVWGSGAIVVLAGLVVFQAARFVYHRRWVPDEHLPWYGVMGGTLVMLMMLWPLGNDLLMDFIYDWLTIGVHPLLGWELIMIPDGWRLLITLFLVELILDISIAKLRFREETGDQSHPAPRAAIKWIGPVGLPWWMTRRDYPERGEWVEEEEGADYEYD